MGRTIHGQTGSKTYRSWAKMKKRCLNPNHNRFKTHGARGIKVCDRWLHSFTNFLEDMGERPEGLTLDRIDNDGNYCKENCKWSNNLEQCRNKRNNVRLTFNGQTKCLSEWSEVIGINYDTLSYRLNHGWPIEKTLTTAPRKTGR